MDLDEDELLSLSRLQVTFNFTFFIMEKVVEIKMRATEWILMRTNHFHFLNHSDFLFYFLHHGKDGGDKDASHRVDIDDDKSLSFSKSP